MKYLHKLSEYGNNMNRLLLLTCHSIHYCYETIGTPVADPRIEMMATILSPKTKTPGFAH